MSITPFKLEALPRWDSGTRSGMSACHGPCRMFEENWIRITPRSKTHSVGAETSRNKDNSDQHCTADDERQAAAEFCPGPVRENSHDGLNRHRHQQADETQDAEGGIGQVGGELAHLDKSSAADPGCWKKRSTRNQAG